MPGDISHLIEHDSLKTWMIDATMSQVGLLDAAAESCWAFNSPNLDDDWPRISDVNLWIHITCRIML
jgi:hypothetical protein